MGISERVQAVRPRGRLRWEPPHVAIATARRYQSGPELCLTVQTCMSLTVTLLHVPLSWPLAVPRSSARRCGPPSLSLSLSVCDSRDSSIPVQHCVLSAPTGTHQISAGFFRLCFDPRQADSGFRLVLSGSCSGQKASLQIFLLRRPAPGVLSVRPMVLWSEMRPAFQSSVRF